MTQSHTCHESCVQLRAPSARHCIAIAYDSSQLCAFNCVPCLNYICAMPHSCIVGHPYKHFTVRRDSLTHVCAMPQSHECYELVCMSSGTLGCCVHREMTHEFKCVQWLMHICNTKHVFLYQCTEAMHAQTYKYLYMCRCMYTCIYI